MASPHSCSRRCRSSLPSSARWAPPTPFARPTRWPPPRCPPDTAAPLVHAAAACPAGAGDPLGPDPVLGSTRPSRSREPTTVIATARTPETAGRSRRHPRRRPPRPSASAGRSSRADASPRVRPTGRAPTGYGSPTAAGRSTAGRTPYRSTGPRPDAGRLRSLLRARPALARGPDDRRDDHGARHEDHGASDVRLDRCRRLVVAVLSCSPSPPPRRVRSRLRRGLAGAALHSTSPTRSWSSRSSAGGSSRRSSGTTGGSSRGSARSRRPAASRPTTTCSA